MNCYNAFHTFQFQNNFIFDNDIQAIAAVQRNALVLYRQWDLPLKFQASKM